MTRDELEHDPAGASAPQSESAGAESVRSGAAGEEAGTAAPGAHPGAAAEPPSGSGRLLDLPSEALPREKLLREGRASLSDDELIAISLRTGLQGCNVLELAARLRRQAGSLAALGMMEAQDFMQLCKGIGPAKAATLAAVFELGSRAVREEVQRRPLTSPREVYELLAPDLRFEAQENLELLMLDARGLLLRREHIARGTLTRVVVHPRDIFGHAVRHRAASIIIAHNHPSGNPSPSRQDRELTTAIESCARVMMIPLRDHVIIGSPSSDGTPPYFSFRDHGLLS